jgi:hypothetical protein
MRNYDDCEIRRFSRLFSRRFSQRFSRVFRLVFQVFPSSIDSAEFFQHIYLIFPLKSRDQIVFYLIETFFLFCSGTRLPFSLKSVWKRPFGKFFWQNLTLTDRVSKLELILQQFLDSISTKGEGRQFLLKLITLFFIDCYIDC